MTFFEGVKRRGYSLALLLARKTYEAVIIELASADRETELYRLLSDFADALMSFISGIELLREALLS